MSLTLNVSHTIFWVTIADFKQENVYLDSFFWVWNYIHIQRCCQVHVQAQSVVAKCTYKLRETGGQPPPISWSKIFFPRKIGTHKIFTCEEHMRLEFIYWTGHKWQKVDSFFSFCHFSSKLSYHSYQQRVCKIMFPIRTFVKTNSNFMCGSFLLCQVIARTTDTKTKSKIISR